MEVTRTELIRILIEAKGFWSTNDLEIAEAVAKALIKEFTGSK